MNFFKFITSIALMFINMSLFAQGWLGSGQNLYTVNSPSFTSVNVGIGTTTPTSQFHTTGTLRFAGLTNNNSHPRVLVSDANGNIFWRDASSIGQQNAWLLTGNTGTSPSTNFLGTTDNVRLVFRTANTERMTILANGNVGIGLNAPTAPMHVFSSNRDLHAFISGSSPSLRFFEGAAWTGTGNMGRLGLASIANDFVNGSAAGDFIVQTLTASGSLILGTGSSGSNGVERMRLNSVGYAGIATSNPTAKLHVQCVAISGQTNPSNIRFEALQVGSGTPLVIDANGYVYQSASQLAVATPGNQVLVDELEKTKKELQELKNSFNELQRSFARTANKAVEQTDRAKLFEGKPNPFTNETLIEYYLPDNSKTASIMITNLEGKSVKSQTILSRRGKGYINFSSAGLSAGVYLCSLIVNSEVIETKKLVLSSR